MGYRYSAFLMGTSKPSTPASKPKGTPGRKKKVIIIIIIYKCLSELKVRMRLCIEKREEKRIDIYVCVTMINPLIVTTPCHQKTNLSQKTLFWVFSPSLSPGTQYGRHEKKKDNNSQKSNYYINY